MLSVPGVPCLYLALDLASLEATLHKMGIIGLCAREGEGGGKRGRKETERRGGERKREMERDKKERRTGRWRELRQRGGGNEGRGKWRGLDRVRREGEAKRELGWCPPLPPHSCSLAISPLQLRFLISFPVLSPAFSFPVSVCWFPAHCVTVSVLLLASFYKLCPPPPPHPVCVFV